MRRTLFLMLFVGFLAAPGGEPTAVDAASVLQEMECGFQETLTCGAGHWMWADAGGNSHPVHTGCASCPLGSTCHAACWPEDEDEDLQLA